MATPGFRAIAVVVLLAFAACRQAEPPRAPESAVHDDFGTPVTFGAKPQRIVSLNPTTTEILVAIGAMPRLVGRSQYDTFPDSVQSVPSLGIALRPSVEAILAEEQQVYWRNRGGQDGAARTDTTALGKQPEHG